MLCYRIEGVKCIYIEKIIIKIIKGRKFYIDNFFFIVVYFFIIFLVIFYICLNFRVKLYGVVDKLMDISLEIYVNVWNMC